MVVVIARINKVDLLRNRLELGLELGLEPSSACKTFLQEEDEYIIIVGRAKEASLSLTCVLYFNSPPRTPSYIAIASHYFIRCFIRTHNRCRPRHLLTDYCIPKLK